MSAMGACSRSRSAARCRKAARYFSAVEFIRTFLLHLASKTVEKAIAARHSRYPTLPSSEIEISFCASTANSIGSCCSTSLTKPLTTSAVASSADMPRWRQ